MKFAIGNDHAAVDCKWEIMSYLKEKGNELVNVGTDTNESFPYPVSAYRVAEMVADGDVDGGILICGTGAGMAMAANKVKGIRACACSDPVTAALTKKHNNANVICFGARIVGIELAKSIVDAWIQADYEGGRHDARIALLGELEDGKAIRRE